MHKTTKIFLEFSFFFSWNFYSLFFELTLHFTKASPCKFKYISENNIKIFYIFGLFSCFFTVRVHIEGKKSCWLFMSFSVPHNWLFLRVWDIHQPKSIFDSCKQSLKHLLHQPNLPPTCPHMLFIWVSSPLYPETQYNDEINFISRHLSKVYSFGSLLNINIGTVWGLDVSYKYLINDLQVLFCMFI